MRRSNRLFLAPLTLATIGIAVACGGNGGSDSATPAPTPTITPDLSSALPGDEAIDALAAIDPRFGSLFASATTGDAAALEELFYWQDRPCGDPAIGEATCLAETPPGTIVKSIEYGPVSGSAEQELVDQYLRRLTEDGMKPRLVLLGDQDPPLYWIYFTSDGSAPVEPPFGGATAFGGVGLTVDLSKVGPVMNLEFLPDDWKPQNVADASGEGETILLYDP